MGKKLTHSRVQRISSFDYKDFEERINDLQSYRKIIEKQNTTHQILMKNQLLVSLVSTLEVNLKSFLSYLIDYWNIPAKEILSESSIEIKLEVLDHLKSSNFTKGTIITAHLDNLHPSKISRIMNRINKLNYFKWFDSITDSSNAYDELLNLYKDRNDIVHNLTDTNKSVEDLEAIIITTSQMYSILMVVTQFNLGIFEKKWSTSKINEYYEAYLIDFPYPLEKIKKTTMKFRKEYVIKSKK